MKRLLFAMAIATFSFGTAQAASSSNGGSEFFFQSAPGVSSFTPAIAFQSGTLRQTGTTVDTKLSGFGVGAAYEYGLNDMFSLGLDLVYLSRKLEVASSDYKTTGLEDPEIFLKGTSAMGPARLRFGANLGLGLAKHKAPSTTEDGNNSTGGLSLAPYVGFDTDAGGGIFGARLSYKLKFVQTQDTTPETKYKGGDELGLAAFYEFMTADMLFGADLHYTSIAEVKNDATDAQVFKSYGPIGVEVYGRIPAGTVAIIPVLSYDFSSSNYDTYSVFQGSLAARFSF